MLPPLDVEALRGINVKSWANETLDMLREFIAYTPDNDRCMSKTTDMTKARTIGLNAQSGG